jgi:predicted Zn-dependent protease
MGLGALGLSVLGPRNIFAQSSDLLQQGIGAAANVVGAMLTLPDEVTLGNALYGRVIAMSGGTYHNTAIQQSIQRVAGPLIGASARPELQWEIVVLDDNAVNAWSLPGGKLAVNKGLLRYVANEDELAAVISHEIGHVDCSHALEEMKTERFTSSLSSSARDALASNTSGGVAIASTAVADALQEPMMKMATSGYSRGAEREADAYILKIFGKTGFDPRKAPDFFRTLTQLAPHDTKATTSLFSTYPDTMERIALLEKASQSLPARTHSPSVAFNQIKSTFPTRLYYRRLG